MIRSRVIRWLVGGTIAIVLLFYFQSTSTFEGFVQMVPSGPCGEIITVHLNAKLTATSCSHPWTLRPPDAPHRSLSVAVTSPIADVRLRAERRKPWLFPHNDSFSYMFFVGATDDDGEQQALEEEMKTYGDIVQLNYLDTYENLTIKSIGAAVWYHHWRRTHGKTKPWFWLKVEDYMANSFDEIIEVVAEARSAGDESLYVGGSIFGGGKVMRQGRWGCNPRHCPYDTFPTKYAGGQYLLGNEAVAVLEKHGLPKLDLADPYPIEDHYVANTLKLDGGIDVKREKRVWWKGPPYNAPYVTLRNGHNFLQQRWKN
eukprot:TRINITY_DN11118_c1_g1_i1.p2 TRINITY_DN11118_c1_g1~~TRINITY_DN11118_c1_g1_i1.p2  ORF type:complete len:314 (+),score=46.99 TRINITY_DN11118_c1_g1_i1:1285-2226(+)